ncbi:MAG: ATPase, T2SS/T4P/T4SS family, partial [Bacillota bacterium]|nr:ATPase, T2SS/T4P/T4SS family [Bacillota bacterium]
MVQAMNTGHPGSFTSIHANSARDALNERLPVLMQMAEGVSISNETCMRMIASTIDIVIHIQKDRDGVRRMTQIVQVIGTQKDPKSDSIIVQTEDLFKYSHNKKDWVKTTAEFKFAERLQARGVDFTW